MTNENKFDPIKQLEELIKRFPDELKQDCIFIDIHGVILDYMARTNISIEYILLKYPKLYPALFEGDSKTEKRTATFLRDILNDTQKRLDARSAGIKRGWPKIESMINDIERKQNIMQTSSKADLLAGHRVEGVIWQLSDIHFGKFNKLELDAKSLAETLVAIGNDSPSFEPRLILVSGDITSSSEDSEYQDFLLFCKTLSEGLWGQYRPHRILVIPGNHETTWSDDGTADQLSKFKKFIASTGLVTPFWDRGKTFKDSDGEVSILRFDRDDKPETPPFVLFKDKRLKIQILLLISSYYSGNVPEKVRELLHNASISNIDTLKSLQNILREDKGEMGRDYILHLKTTLKDVDCPTFALSHHHLHQYGLDACQNSYSKVLLESLASKGIRLILHGHTHLIEEKGSSRIVDSSQAYPIPCPTLCSDSEPGSSFGFMMHFIGPDSTPRNVSTAVWLIDNAKFFNIASDRLFLRYKYLLYRDKLELI